jgi:2-desacetyl-2-hydroxyethyl bacteriochlorophyllide A dehydrogenase
MEERQSLTFMAPQQVEIRTEPRPAPGEGQALVQSICSAISCGTENLIFSGQFPQELALDENLNALGGGFGYPLKYGYSVVGRVVQVGPGVNEAWLGRVVFGFNPHESHFVAAIDDLMTLPEGLAPEDGVFLPNMETAVNLVMDGAPLLGERVAVLGQGVVGLLTTALLAHFPLAQLTGIDRCERRLQTGRMLGAHLGLPPEAAVEKAPAEGYDLVYELTGAPAALNTAISLAGFDSRVVIGSWYGQKQAPVNLGGKFHRSRMRLISSQVSTVAPHLRGRWGKERRFEVAWEMLRRVRPGRLITHRVKLQEAAQAYEMIQSQPNDFIQIVFTY